MFPVKSIGVIGGGVVGQATAASYRAFSEVRVYDSLIERRTHSFWSTMTSDIVFICLPTPQRDGGLECDTDCLVGFFESLADELRTTNMVIRSTVPIGFTRHWATQSLDKCPNLVHSPEFLTARTAKYDAADPRVNVIGFGASVDVITRMNWPVWKVYRARWPETPIHHMSSDESEAVKSVQNGFSAVKIAYFNEIYALLQKKGCDYGTVIEALLTQGWVNPMHTKVPGPDGKFGFGGSCLPKDLASLTVQLQEAACTSLVTRAAYDRNLLDRLKETK